MAKAIVHHKRRKIVPIMKYVCRDCTRVGHEYHISRAPSVQFSPSATVYPDNSVTIGEWTLSTIQSQKYLEERGIPFYRVEDMRIAVGRQRVLVFGNKKLGVVDGKARQKEERERGQMMAAVRVTR